MDINVRRIEPDDARDLHDLFSQPKAIAGTLQIPFPDIQSWQARCEKVPDHISVLVAEVESKVVGNLALVRQPRHLRRNHVAQLGMAVHDDWQGNGIGTKLLQEAINLADNWLDLSRIELSVFVDNAAAIALYKKNGFELEGTCKNYAFRNGEYSDVYAMARIR